MTKLETGYITAMVIVAVVISSCVGYYRGHVRGYQVGAADVVCQLVFDGKCTIEYGKGGN